MVISTVAGLAGPLVQQLQVVCIHVLAYELIQTLYSLLH